MKTYPEIISSLRRSVKALGGVKLKLETLSWGAHANFIFSGPNGEEHRAGNVSPVWWTSEHVKKYENLAMICEDTRNELAAIGEKLPGLLKSRE